MKHIAFLLTLALLSNLLMINDGFVTSVNLVQAQDTDQPVTTIDTAELSIPESIINEIKAIGANVDYYEQQKIKPLRLSATDKIALEDGKIDKRVMETLVKLTTPKEHGGYGHKLKVTRVIKNYRGKKNLSKESDYQTESGEEAVTPNISAHNEQQAQAFDIEEIDEYQCTTKTLTGSKKTPPKPVKVLWQDTAPGTNAPGVFSSPRLFGEDFADIGTNIFSDQLVLGLSDNLDTYLETFNLQGSSLPDVIKGLGLARWEEEFGSLPFPKTTNLDELAKSIGLSYIGRELNLNTDDLAGKNNETLLTNVALGRLERELGVEGIQGNSVNDWLEPIFKRKVESILRLDANSLDKLKTGITARALAQAKFSALTNIPVELLDNNKSDIEKVYGASFDQIISSPATIDNQLTLAPGTTRAFLNGSLSSNDFYKKIEDTIKASFRPTYAYPDKTFNLPEGTIKSFLDTGLFSSTTARKAGLSILGQALKLDDTHLQTLLETIGQGGTINKLDATRADVTFSPEEITALLDSSFSKRAEIIQKSGLFVLDQLTQSKAKDLYVGFRPQKIKDIINNKLSIEDYATTIGSNYLETYFDLDPGSLNVLASKTSIFNPSGATKDKILGQIAQSLNLDLELDNFFRGAPAQYKITPRDVSLLLKGNQTAITDKVGGMLMDAATQGLKGNSFDMLKGTISPERLLANTALASITQNVLKTNPEQFGPPGIVAGQDQRIGAIATFIEKELKAQGDKITSDRILSALGLEPEELKGYDFKNLNSIITSLKDPKNNASGLKTDLTSLMGEVLAAKSGLPSGSFTGMVKDPKNTQIKLAEYGLNYLETNVLGIEKDSLVKLYKDKDVDLKEILLPTVDKIISQTGIGDKVHASWFIDGNIDQGLKAAGIAAFTKQINDGLTNPAAKVSYNLIANAYFSDTSHENVAYQAAQIKATSITSDPTQQQLYVNQVMRDTRLDVRKQANYALMDAQLIKKDSSIPVGFSQKIFEGNDQQRIDLLKDYAISKIGITDSELSDKIGLPVPEGTTAILKEYATGKVTFDAVKTKLEAGGKEAITNFGFAFGDKTLGFAPGTTKHLYESYKQYQTIKASFQAGKMSSGEFRGAQIALAVTAIDTITGGAITKLTSPIDDALGLPAGTSLQIAMAIVTGNPVGAALAIAGAIFGFGKTKCPDLKKLAQEKIRAVLDATYTIAEKSKGTKQPLIPSQVLTWRDEDITDVRQKYGALYGPDGTLDKAGIFKTLNPREIHVGY